MARLEVSESKPPAAPSFRPDSLVLLYSPTGKDASMMQRVLEVAGVRARECASIEELCARLLASDTAVIAEEALTVSTVAALTGVLLRQPRWSDYPLIVLGLPESTSSVRLFERLSPVASGMPISQRGWPCGSSRANAIDRALAGNSSD